MTRIVPDNKTVFLKHISSALLVACSFILILFASTGARAQSMVDYKIQVIGLGDEQENVIQNAAHLEDFFEALHLLKTRNDRKVNIIHIGDSHIQGDYLTQPIRRNFQQHFGNAGRGLVFPGKIAETNESYNIVSSSNVRWQAKRCVYPDQPLPIGIGGITIQTSEPGAKLEVHMNDLWMDYSFNRIVLFFQKDVSSFHFSLRDSSSTELVAAPFSKDLGLNHSTLQLARPVESVTIETVRNSIQQKQATLFGLSLENEKYGILYHSVGVNGAKYKHYNAAVFFHQQTSVLDPQLFIISLGTNEALDYPYLDRNFYQHMDKLITSLHKTNPGAKFILSTPPAALLKTGKPNPGVMKIREQIIQYAAENGLAFWDLYKTLGGENSLTTWSECAWLRPDGIHYTKDAYEHQGNLLFHAIIKSYNQYVSVRHP